MASIILIGVAVILLAFLVWWQRREIERLHKQLDDAIFRFEPKITTKEDDEFTWIGCSTVQVNRLDSAEERLGRLEYRADCNHEMTLGLHREVCDRLSKLESPRKPAKPRKAVRK